MKKAHRVLLGAASVVMFAACTADSMSSSLERAGAAGGSPPTSQADGAPLPETGPTTDGGEEATPREGSSGPTTLGRSGGKFTINGAETFLLGVTYFDALDWRTSDLEAFQAHGFNLIRILLDKEWELGPGVETVFDADGSLIPSRRDTVMQLVRAAGERGMVVDVSVLYADTDGINSAIWLNTAEARRSAIKNAVAAYAGEPNVLFDLVNEHNGGSFSASEGEMAGYMAAGRAGSGSALLGYSSAEAFGDHLLHAADDSLNTSGLAGELDNGVQILMPHNKRGTDWSSRSGARARNLRAGLDAAGHPEIPVYFQEENRRRGGYGNSAASEFIQGAVDCKANGCAAWIFHTDTGFQLANASFMSQLDSVEMEVMNSLAAALGL